ncbi:hypothetical protein E6P09_01840 [Haloferax mediterranei ATCC 33500]|uniref:Uncharacterized protein n=1 Tax=Haloferax mediterranei (strain ATCC 33500 / DSM 1411 / JCM 8866 / NBRC 14739 / NCIMB 2177 / R-4) TaxID=523841 RepID=I3R603_HALMT|nr:hypothetical protein [Haloferax mediterranei]AFK19663.1 hypothetical protein HFX_1970 [Haloferax mediterranei ATCC 33500]AHZ23052.1 hypothetical protein BM92_10580 [Haloferax mediterranei ATCC 33500]ELZ99983.1 hypothetical protein C439_11628 [Haloferax mediterranei ATCC 33500]MDX5987595.1 hypothetical protein [Haloferax mediterranei ATCC 33500]QCQ74083.1 hypothetical protein E6P09_01840 [Haloferax mediterranei ATCC 33500]
MGAGLTRRELLVVVGATAGLAGYNEPQDNTETPGATATAANGTLVVPAETTTTTTSVEWFDSIEWHDGGRLVIEANTGLGLADTEA